MAFTVIASSDKKAGSSSNKLATEGKRPSGYDSEVQHLRGILAQRGHMTLYLIQDC